METKNICGKIPVELHEKVREELEGTEMTIPQFLQKVIEEHFMKKGVEKMEALKRESRKGETPKTRAFHSERLSDRNYHPGTGCSG